MGEKLEKKSKRWKEKRVIVRGIKSRGNGEIVIDGCRKSYVYGKNYTKVLVIIEMELPLTGQT